MGNTKGLSAAPDCVIRAADAEWQVAAATQKAAKWATKVRPKADRNQFRPITENEAKALIRALEPVKLKKDKGWVIRAVVEGTKLSLQRIAVLVGDVRTVLAEMHGEALLKDLRSQPNLDRGAVEWAERAGAMLGPCTIGRFAERGGEKVLLQTRGVVEKFRERLEPLVLQDLHRFGVVAR